MCNFALWIDGGHVPLTSGKPITTSTLQLIGLLKVIGNMKKKRKPRFGKEELLRRLYNVHGHDKLDFSLIEDDSFVYDGVETVIPIICKRCGGIHKLKAKYCLDGSGCNLCRHERIAEKLTGRPRELEKRAGVAGVGINDVAGLVIHNKSYKVWKSMIDRCYNEDTLEKRPAYKDCEVCEEWKYYSNYKEWYDKNYVEGFYVDKDLLSFNVGKRVYSPETCCFLPHELNSALAISRSKHANTLPVGVYIIDNSIAASCGGVYLGVFNTVEEAKDAVFKAKKEHITILANKWKDKIEPRAYDALINLDVEKFFSNN